MDGVDAAIITSDGEGSLKQGATYFNSYDEPVRAAIKQAIQTAKNLDDRTARPPKMAQAEHLVTQAHIAAVQALLEQASLEASRIDIIGFHGQTVLHAPERALTIQIGDGAALAKASGIDVVCDLRAQDMVAGGQGAPLAPVYHQALVAGMADRPVVMVNIGGVGNVTWIDADNNMLAFDTGPGNALIDDWMQDKAGKPHDEGGAVAAKGEVNATLLGQLLDNSYFAQTPPKSLDRNAFSLDALGNCSLEEGAATLTAFTVASLVRAAEHFSAPPKRWIICGGGRKNQTMMAMLEAQLLGEVMAAEDVGIDGDFLEAQAFGYMAIRSLKNLPITYPGTTGVKQPQTGGVFHKA